MINLRKRMVVVHFKAGVEAAACYKAGDEAVACSGTGIEDYRWQWQCSGF
jgi:hypothetical protein